MCVVIIVMGFMIMPLAQIYNNQMEQQRAEKTRAKIIDLTSMATARKDAIGSFPCPSDRSLPPSDDNYGVDVSQYPAPLAIPACDGTMQGICRTNGARDTDIDVDATIDPILIGGFPIKTLQIAMGENEIQGTVSSQLGIDSWGNQYTYAVSEKLCEFGRSANTKDFLWGVIEALDEYGNPTAGIGTTDLDGIGTAAPDGQFVILSHGPTGRGAFSQEGSPVENCDITTVEGENCDNDFTFTAALSNYKADTNDFFDDIIYFHLYKPSSLWNVMYKPDALGKPVATPDIMALNERYVGILTDNPQVKLDVAGDIAAATIKSPRFCFNDGTKCFEYNWLGTTSSVTSGANRNTCGTAGQVITYVGNNSITCVTPSIQNPGTDRRCDAIDPLKPYLRGIKTNGELICTN